MRKTAMYPGSFDPFTNGHLDIVKKLLSCLNWCTSSSVSIPASAVPSRRML